MQKNEQDGGERRTQINRYHLRTIVGSRGLAIFLGTMPAK